VMHGDPNSPAWTRVPLALIALFVVVTVIAIYDFTANGNESAMTGIVGSSIGALAWAWVYRQIKRS